MTEIPNIPDNIDNCINYCPSLINLIEGGAAKMAAFCIEHQCPGPIVQERIVDISHSSAEEPTAMTLVKVCGSKPDARSFTGSRPGGYTYNIQGEGEMDPFISIAADETILVRELSQEEIRRELRHRDY